MAEIGKESFSLKIWHAKTNLINQLIKQYNKKSKIQSFYYYNKYK